VSASTPLLTTKLSIPPPRPHERVVSRPRLHRRLEEGLSCPLTLISAPAGFGKTTLVSEWLSETGRRSAWLSLEDDDNDPTRFLTYLVAALAALKPGIGDAALAVLQSPQPPPPKTILTALINDLSTISAPCALALDDYHAITAQPIHDALAFLLDHRPSQMHLILLTRADPPLPLSRLRARSQLTEIRAADLRFTSDEAADFLNQVMGLNLSAEDIAALEARTEGWIAGLQLAALSLQGHDAQSLSNFIAAFTGSHHYIVDYLAEEVLNRQPDFVRDFLLQTSILDRLTGPLCDAVLGKDEGGGMKDENSTLILAQLERANLFLVPLDEERRWYRYHHLFADVLRNRLRQARPEHLVALHQRASRWYAQAGDPDEALKHALAIPDHALAANLAEQFMLRMTGSSRLGTYLSWLQRIPDEVIRSRAYLCAGCGWAYVLTHQLDAAGKYVEAGEAALPDYKPIHSAPDGRWITRDEVCGNLAAIRSYADRQRGDFPGAIEHARQALETLPPAALAVRCAVALNLGMLHMDSGELELARKPLYEAFETAIRSEENVYVAVSALSLLGGIAAMQGKLKEAEGIFHRAIQCGTDASGRRAPLPSVGVAHGWLMLLHYQRNEIAAAQEHLDIVLQAARQLGVPDVTIRAYLYQALLAQCHGEFGPAEDWFGRAEQLMQAHPAQDLIETEWIAFRGQLYLMRGDLAAAAKLMEAHGVQATDLEGQPAPSGEQTRSLGPRLARYLLLARVLLAQGAIDQAANLLDRVCAIAEAYLDFAIFLAALALQAIAAHRMGDQARALRYLERALTLAAPEGYVRTFVDEGIPMVELLRHAGSHGIAPKYVVKLLSEIARASDVTPASAQPLVEPLSERELEVLRLIAAGLSNEEIARELVLALGTVKAHTASIFRKLDVRSRVQAVVRARELNLLQ
jgi:LuxR family maltose regulon positive regulatory protein